jgi:hypothetical protein
MLLGWIFGADAAAAGLLLARAAFEPPAGK